MKALAKEYGKNLGILSIIFLIIRGGAWLLNFIPFSVIIFSAFVAAAGLTYMNRKGIGGLDLDF